MQFKIQRNIDEDIWNTFVDNHPQGSIFHTSKMFDVYNKAHGHKSELWAAGDGDELLALFLPVNITLFNGPLRSYTSRGVAYGSILCVQNQRGRDALGELLKVYNHEVKGRLLFTEFRNLFDLNEFHPILNEHGFSFEDHLNFLIQLNRPTQDIWKNIRDNARRNIKKAQRSNVEIDEVQNIDEIDCAYNILKQVYHRIQVPLPHISLFRSAFEILNPVGMIKVLLAKVNETKVGVLFLLLHKGIVNYWYTGTLREYASLRVGDLLVWHALEYGAQNDYQLFDFGGGGVPGEPYGVRDFKAKFGGEIVNYGRNVCVHSPKRLKISQVSYQFLRRFM